MEFFVQVGCRFAGMQPSFESSGFRGFARAAKISEALLEALLSALIFVLGVEVRLRNTALGLGFIESGPVIVIQSRDPISFFFRGRERGPVVLAIPLGRWRALLCTRRWRNRGHRSAQRLGRGGRN